MLSCKEISKLANDHIDNDLPLILSMKVRMHLFMCHKCRDFVKQLQTTINVLKSLNQPPLKESFVTEQVNELMDIAKKNLPDKSDKP